MYSILTTRCVYRRRRGRWRYWRTVVVPIGVSTTENVEVNHHESIRQFLTDRGLLCLDDGQQQ
jgi:hypothetical protein